MPIPDPTFLEWRVHIPGGGALYFGFLLVPDLMTEPVRRQMAVSYPLSSLSSDRPSRTLTRLTILYSSTNDFGSLIKQFIGEPKSERHRCIMRDKQCSATTILKIVTHLHTYLVYESFLNGSSLSSGDLQSCTQTYLLLSVSVQDQQVVSQRYLIGKE